MAWHILESQTPLAEILLRMALAVAFGMVIGIDREVRSKPAGLRTHMLISLAAATFTILALELSATAMELGEYIRADPVRVTEAVVTGVAFLGAGSIIRSRGEVEGVTTGASIWLSGAVGVACGGGFYVVAACALGFAMLVLTIVGLLEYRVKRHLDGEGERTGES